MAWGCCALAAAETAGCDSCAAKRAGSPMLLLLLLLLLQAGIV
jgi:hypothetical protein